MASGIRGFAANAAELKAGRYRDKAKSLREMAEERLFETPNPSTDAGTAGQRVCSGLNAPNKQPTMRRLRKGKTSAAICDQVFKGCRPLRDVSLCLADDSDGRQAVDG